MARLKAWVKRTTASGFYGTDRRDDGLFHLLRDEATAFFANNQAININTNWATANLRAAANGVPPNAKGVIFWATCTGDVVGTELRVIAGGGTPGTFGKRVVRIPVVAQTHLSSFNGCLFGLTLGVPNGILTFRAATGNITAFYAACIGWIA